MIDNFELWRQRALEFRQLAGSIEGEDARQTMLRIADDYARLAARATPQPDVPLAQVPVEVDPPHALPWALGEAS